MNTKKLVKVSPRISVFIGTVASRTGRDELASIHSADRDAVRASIELFPKHIQKTLRSHTCGIRDLIKKYSIPYSDGQRVMKASNYPKLESELNKLEAAYKTYVMDEIIGRYDEHLELAKKRLNGLYTENVFPSKERLASKYGFKIIIDPLTATDKDTFFIEGLDEAQIEEIRKNLEKEISDNLKEGQARIVDELREGLYNILKKTTNDDARYNTAIKNLINICDNISNTNVLEVDAINDIANDIKSKLGKITTASVKANGDAGTKKVKTITSDLMTALDQIAF
jgi:hypothetical protein